MENKNMKRKLNIKDILGVEDVLIERWKESGRGMSSQIGNRYTSLSRRRKRAADAAASGKPKFEIVMLDGEQRILYSQPDPAWDADEIQARQCLRTADLIIDLNASQVYQKEEAIRMGATEYELLVSMLKNAQRLCRREFLLGKAEWMHTRCLSDNALSAHISRIRKHLEEGNKTKSKKEKITAGQRVYTRKGEPVENVVLTDNGKLVTCSAADSYNRALKENQARNKRLEKQAEFYSCPGRKQTEESAGPGQEKEPESRNYIVTRYKLGYIWNYPVEVCYISR